MIGVERTVRRKETSIPAAKHNVASGTLTLGKIDVKQRPKAAPAAKKGKITPPRYPPATAKLIVTILATPTMKALSPEFISKPINPGVGQAYGSEDDGAIVAIAVNSNSPQKST
mmetsp:Transcript_37808/g.66296  ORF Transcript_37808/g.66296 Transcript_37808/m.66296 type:complete len:114 (+) Transcript_37808:329-670(+)